MPRRCNVFWCHGNYTKTVGFPKKETHLEERDRWINAIPNDRASLLKFAEINACITYFNCEWVSTRGGKTPVYPPSIFPGVPQSCMKQS